MSKPLATKVSTPLSENVQIAPNVSIFSSTALTLLGMEFNLFFFRFSVSYLPWGAMLNFQWPVWESKSECNNTKFNTPAPHSHLRPCNTSESHHTEERKGELGSNWSFSLRGVLTFVASGLDINGCVLSCFEGTADLHCYTSCTLTTLHCSKVSFLQCCHMKIYKKYLLKCEGCTNFCEILYLLMN